ncbi:hypothetical protein B0T11DRAFT_20240 [Plectosphaerella cucumerina]|uniref:Uncharacterized protein n=1 Tax=Plectosphaerella cucumerina TaxID=40658 RepID=A0A8K0X9G9_9PEZI|nr:hypothetical protein B0T11DRAFT_20240 [Plectosphaerella cucumerina]
MLVAKEHKAGELSSEAKRSIEGNKSESSLLRVQLKFQPKQKEKKKHRFLSLTRAEARANCVAVAFQGPFVVSPSHRQPPVSIWAAASSERAGGRLCPGNDGAPRVEWAHSVAPAPDSTRASSHRLEGPRFSGQYSEAAALRPASPSRHRARRNPLSFVDPRSDLHHLTPPGSPIRTTQLWPDNPHTITTSITTVASSTSSKILFSSRATITPIDPAPPPRNTA